MKRLRLAGAACGAIGRCHLDRIAASRRQPQAGALCRAMSYLPLSE